MLSKPAKKTKRYRVDDPTKFAGFCFCCRRVVGSNQFVFFGPGALMKCATCGAWSKEDWTRGGLQVEQDVRAWNQRLAAVRFELVPRPKCSAPLLRVPSEPPKLSVVA